MQELGALLADLAVPEVAIAEHIEDGHQNGAEYDLAHHNAHDLGAVLLREEDTESALDKASKVRLDSGNVGIR